MISAAHIVSEFVDVETPTLFRRTPGVSDKARHCFLGQNYFYLNL
jgi:hypothetical protein